MEFLCNVDEEYVPKVGMTFKPCTEANEFYKEYAKRAGFASRIRNSQRKMLGSTLEKQIASSSDKKKRKALSEVNVKNSKLFD
ncbi:hypothetical protein PIB30_006911 [Stylosanthes scabra]|uniref:Protein FAR1-RELATED SEQUENCE n=1 Tax=Stylosanthes scabra TaxID=79078 RepID=A0ABU6X3Y8_9FABA|nr:hypothetical protein [Stylosanthes scabra]